MHWTAFLAYRRFPAHARVMEDCACIQCGYNLRMQLVAARCPECGSEVGNSVFLLARPTVASRGLRSAAASYLAPLALMFTVFSIAYWSIFVVSLIATVAAVFRVIGVSDLRFNAALARLPVVGSRLTLWWLATWIDIALAGAWMTGLIVVSNTPSVQNTAFATTVIVGGGALWFAAMFLSSWAAGRFGLALMDMLNFTWTRIEFRVQQITTMLAILLGLILAIGIRALSPSLTQSLLSGALLLMTWLVMVGTCVALLHAATACDESTADWDDLIDSERIAVIPESQPPQRPEAPPIRIEE